MSKRAKKGPKNSPAPVEAIDGEVTTVEATETTVIDAETVEIAEAVEPVVDADVLAMLAGDDTATDTTVAADETPEITEDDVDPPSDEEVLAALSKPEKKTRKAKADGSTPAAPVIQRAFTAVAAIDQPTLDANLAGCNAKKVREKADNLIAAVQSGKKLSRYTQVAVKQLKADGRISGKSMTAAFQAEGLSDGTSRAQSQQMTALFKIVGAVSPDPSNPRELVLQDNALVEELVKLAA